MDASEAGSPGPGTGRGAHPRLDPRGLAADKKNASRLRAWLVFLDETGLLTSPHLRRTWAPRGETPTFYQRGNSRQKATAIAAVCVSPKRCKVRLFFSLRAHENIHTDWYCEFLRKLHRELGGRMVVVQDNLNVHRAAKIQKLARKRRCLKLAYLPPYAPELNPPEYLWSYVKMNRLSNWAPENIDELARVAGSRFRGLQADEALLRAVIEASPLSLRLK